MGKNTPDAFDTAVQQAYSAMRVVLHRLRDCLPPPAAGPGVPPSLAHFAAATRGAEAGLRARRGR